MPEISGSFLGQSVGLAVRMTLAGTLAASLLVAPGMAQNLPNVSLETSETLFTVLTAINICGYDQELNASDPLRMQIRSEVGKTVENTPGADSNSVKDKEGTIQADKDTGKRIEDAAKGAAVGGTVGSIAGVAAGGLNGARYGGLAGIAGGVAWALLKHGPDVKLDVGTSIEMEIQRSIPVDASRIQVARAGS